jgi:hypothetical protein
MSNETENADVSEFERHFFEGAEIVTLEIPVLKETYDDLVTVIERNGWDPDEGLRTLLTLGLGYTQGQRLLQADDEERARLAERLNDLESVAAVMKFRTFSFMRDNQVLEMRTGALENAKTGLEAVIRRLRPERDALKQEVDELRMELEGLQARLARLDAGQPEPEPSWARKLVGRLNSLRHRD